MYPPPPVICPTLRNTAQSINICIPNSSPKDRWFIYSYQQLRHTVVVSTYLDLFCDCRYSTVIFPVISWAINTYLALRVQQSVHLNEQYFFYGTMYCVLGISHIPCVTDWVAPMSNVLSQPVNFEKL